MTNINEEFIEEYLRKLVPKKKDFLIRMEVYAEENHVPIVEPEVAQLIKVLLKSKQAKTILEIGTAIGYSALLMCDALDGKCHITTIERREDMIQLASEFISDSKYKDSIKIINGDANQVLDDISEKFDLIFMDAAKGQYMEFFNKSMDLLNPGGIIIADNVLFRGMVASDELINRRKITIVKRLREFLKYINEVEGFESAIIPIGDGVALIYKEDLHEED
ncbi:MAG TPA: O-methyltransferase [Tissierellaceae bacterium]|nr:O-methyltransferase [Tissierellaceae bacterium]